jgi:hypothetical protein
MEIVLAREDAEVYLHALQTMTIQFQLCERGLVIFEYSIIVQK